MLEVLGISTEWTLRGAAPTGLEAVEIAAAEPVAVEVEADSFAIAESVSVRGELPVIHALPDTAAPRAQRIAAFG